MDLIGAGNNSLTRKKLILNIHCSQCTSTIAGSGCLVHSWITGPGRHGRRKPPALINKAGTFYSSANESSRSVLLQFWKRGGKAWQTTSQHRQKSVHNWACSEGEEEDEKKKKSTTHQPAHPSDTAAALEKAVVVMKEKLWSSRTARAYAELLKCSLSILPNSSGLRFQWGLKFLWIHFKFSPSLHRWGEGEQKAGAWSCCVNSTEGRVFKHRLPLAWLGQLPSLSMVQPFVYCGILMLSIDFKNSKRQRHSDLTPFESQSVLLLLWYTTTLNKGLSELG